ncbi:MAG: hypothetical protein IPP89_17090 [Saprospiraceae bacterium]|nr:hypothetical protein [Candidatus Brachybacter algidus]MBL0120633.1 hypothetical protein [Candidatus Brachybacter algidus]
MFFPCLLLAGCSKDENPEVLESYFFDTQYHDAIDDRVDVAFYSYLKPPITILIDDVVMGKIVKIAPAKPKDCKDQNCLRLKLKKNVTYRFRAYNEDKSKTWEDYLNITKDCTIYKL